MLGFIIENIMNGHIASVINGIIKSLIESGHNNKKRIKVGC